MKRISTMRLIATLVATATIIAAAAAPVVKKKSKAARKKAGRTEMHVIRHEAECSMWSGVLNDSLWLAIAVDNVSPAVIGEMRYPAGQCRADTFPVLGYRTGEGKLRLYAYSPLDGTGLYNMRLDADDSSIDYLTGVDAMGHAFKFVPASGSANLTKHFRFTYNDVDMAGRYSYGTNIPGNIDFGQVDVMRNPNDLSQITVEVNLSDGRGTSVAKATSRLKGDTVTCAIVKDHKEYRFKIQFFDGFLIMTHVSGNAADFFGEGPELNGVFEKEPAVG